MPDHDERSGADAPNPRREDPNDPGGLAHNPGPAGSARYEHGTAPSEIGGPDHDAEGDLDTTRDDVKATEFGGAYGPDRPPLPTDAAWDRGEAPPGIERED
jgi:hypothetical protein